MKGKGYVRSLDECEDCGEREPDYCIRYRCPAEWVYYCSDCADKHRENEKALSIEPIV